MPHKLCAIFEISKMRFFDSKMSQSPFHLEKYPKISRFATLNLLTNLHDFLFFAFFSFSDRHNKGSNIL